LVKKTGLLQERIWGAVQGNKITAINFINRTGTALKNCAGIFKFQHLIMNLFVNRKNQFEHYELCFLAIKIKQ
jgi:hypothetical protein